MTLFDLIATLLVLAAGFSYVNYRLLKLPNTVGLMALTLLSSVVVVCVGQLAPHFQDQAQTFVLRLNLDETLLHGMLGFLLFADASPPARHWFP